MTRSNLIWLTLICWQVAGHSSASAGVVGDEETRTQLAPSYSFSYEGGLSPYFDRFVFSPPLELEITRDFSLKRDPGGPRTCALTVADCGQDGIVDSCDLEKVLLDEHVLAAWPEEGEVLFGFDPRPQDGNVFVIEAPGKGRLIVGELCRKADDGCSNRDEALLELKRTFVRLITQSGSSPDCENLRD